MKRLLHNLWAVASLLLAAGFAFAWIRSHGVADRLIGTTASMRYVDLSSVEGGVELRVAPKYPYRERFEWHVTETFTRTRTPWYALGFAYDRDTIRFMPLDNGPPRIPPAPYWMVRVPYWFCVALFALYPARRLWPLRPGARRRARLAGGLCAHCGYDLRASADRCPECGAAFARPVAAS